MTIELFRPSVPPLDAFIGYLKSIDNNKIYSNFGPIQHLFKERLARHFKVEVNQIELFSSGTMSLVAALQTLKKSKRPYCLLPSWTFTATAQAAVAAGMTPIFIDVDVDSMQLTSKIINKLPHEILDQVSVVLMVAPYGAPLDTSGLQNDCLKYGFDILCDCAAGFESVKAVEFHTVISLHATKTFGIGEGGLLLSPSSEFVAETKAYSNFGFRDSRQSKQLGVNAKLSEFHAAVGLAALDLWDSTRSTYYLKAQKYLELSKNKSWYLQKGWGSDWVSSTCVIKFQSIEHKFKAIQNLAKYHIQTRDWWNQGCHLEPVFKEYKYYDFYQNTLNLTNTTLGIPFYRDIDEDKINQLFIALNHDI